MPRQQTRQDPPLREGVDLIRYEPIPFTDELFPIRILWDMSARPCEQPVALHSWHEQLELLYITHGRLICECDFHRYVCCEGDIVIINPCEAHSVEYLEGDARYHCLMVDPRLYSGRGDISGVKYTEPMSERKLRFHHVVRNERASALLQELLEEYRLEAPAFEMAVKGTLLRLLSELVRHERAESDSKRKTTDASIAPALRYIAECYAQDITLGELAARCCMNRSYFCRRFREITGRTAFAYINEYRLTKSRALLLTTDLPISHVASLCGFADGSYYTRIFSRAYGVSPRTLRAEHKETDGGTDATAPTQPRNTYKGERA